jgi:hypothetical protein
MAPPVSVVLTAASGGLTELLRLLQAAIDTINNEIKIKRNVFFKKSPSNTHACVGTLKL